MIPDSNMDIDLEITDEMEVSNTYKLSETNIQGYTDNLMALKQAIYKLLNTEKYQHEIYSFNYGIELESLIGKDEIYVKIELKRRITECLLYDERITSVDDFAFTKKYDDLLCVFNIKSIFGEFEISKAVNL